MSFKDMIRDVPDFPKKGIIFKDITTLTRNPAGFRDAIDQIVKQYDGAGIDIVVGIEARGFIFGGAIAYLLNAGFVPARKQGKLPAETVRAEYELEYGTDAIEIHRDAISDGQRVLIVDDLLATGGTAAACVELVQKLRGELVGIAFLIDLTFLNGREKLQGQAITSLVDYDGE
ncbi:adenine phosphoribosyltransferase [bacterium]|nr:adenine phosphoribosyltransferase [bacterium]